MQAGGRLSVLKYADSARGVVMRRAVREHSSYIILKPATAAIAVTFVAALCVLSFAVGTTQAKVGYPMPVLAAASSNADDRSDTAADNVAPGADAEPAEMLETAQPSQEEPQDEAQTETAELSTTAEDTADDGEAEGEWETVRMRVTAYCPCPKCCGEHSDGITACGHKVRPGDVFVAADRRFAFYTDMVIEGYGNSQPVKVLDRGGAIKGNKLDVFFMTHQEALEWGVRHIDVKVRRNAASS
mgnify:CR=1 FL=1